MPRGALSNVMTLAAGASRPKESNHESGFIQSH